MHNNSIWRLCIGVLVLNFEFSFDICTVQQIHGEVRVDLSNVDHCDEKEITVAFTIQPETQNDFLSRINVTALWEAIQNKLASAIPSLDEYSINIDNENAGSSREVQKTQETETKLDGCKIGLIKDANDFTRYLKDCALRAQNKNIATRVPLMIKVELFFFFCARIHEIRINKKQDL